MNLKKLKLFFIPLIVCIVFILSIIGYKHHMGDHFNIWGVIYSTIGSFLMHHVSPEPEHGYMVLVAQYLAALILGLGLFALIYEHLKAGYVNAKIKLSYKNHIIVFGLNNIGKQICEQLLHKGYKVVAIEHDHDNIYAHDIQHHGGIVLYDNPGDKETLDKAGLLNASMCILAGDNDVANIELASQIAKFRYEQKHNSKSAIKILAHINNWDNTNVIKDFFDLNNEDDHYDLETFNVHQLSAQKIYDLYPPHNYISNTNTDAEENAIAIIGYNKAAEYFIAENIVLSHYPDLQNLKIYLVDKDADTIFHQVSYKFPFYNEFAEIIPVKLLNGSFFANYTWSKKNIEQLSKIKVAYFFGDNDAALINSVASFRQFLYTQTLNISEVPLVVCLPEDTGIVDLLNSTNNKKEQVKRVFSEQLNIHQFRQITDTCKSEMIEENELADKLSKSINYFYSIKYDFEKQLTAKYKVADAAKVIAELEAQMIGLAAKNSSLSLSEMEDQVLDKLAVLTHIAKEELRKEFSVNKRWHMLTHRKKDSNRYAARHAAVKIHSLKQIGCWPLTIDNIRNYYHRIAPIEHKRWNAEKMLFNFKYGPLNHLPEQKAVLKEVLKIHDQIIPFEKLTEVEKNKDLNLFLLLPLLNNIKQLTS